MSCTTNRVPAGTCGYCFASMENLNRVYLPAKERVAEPRKRFCSERCLTNWMDKNGYNGRQVFNNSRR